MRVDGALHTVAELSRDRYRVIMATLASRANISTASREPQSGHMQQEIHRDGVSHGAEFACGGCDDGVRFGSGASIV